MKISGKPTNIYEITVSQSVSVTYQVYAKSANDAVDKALNSWEKKDVEFVESTIHEQQPESIECIERDIYVS
mgnify:CR=1 FL=1|jgi:fatty acid-binding protein DegV